MRAIPPEGRTSIVKFAKSVGYSPSAIRQFIKKGKIKLGVEYSKGGVPFIVATVAAKELIDNNVPLRNIDSVAKLEDQIARSKPRRGRPKKDAVKPESEPEPEKKTSYHKLPELDEDDDLFSDTDFVSYAEAKRLGEIQRAKILELDYETKSKNLVPVVKINKALFETGQIIRDALTGLPDKTIDLIFNAHDRNEARNIMVEAIAEALESLHSIGTLIDRI